MWVLSKLLRRALRNNHSSCLSSFRTHVEQIVHGLENIQIVFDDNYGVALFYKFLQHCEQNLDVLEM